MKAFCEKYPGAAVVSTTATAVAVLVVSVTATVPSAEYAGATCSVQ